MFFRLPVGDRARRASVPADERVFWHVVISVTWSLIVLMVMAAAGLYRYERLLIVNAVVTLAVMAIGRQRLRWPGTAARVSWTAVLPLLVLALGVWRFFPASEYVIGGKDPGVYVNEGIQIARTGQLFRSDAVVAAVPAEARDLFFPRHDNPLYYSVRFMGVQLNDPATGEVIVAFPHLFPASIALGYQWAGAVGATSMPAAWATLGLLAVFFFGSRLVGRVPAFAATAVLALHVIETWFGRYPSADVVMQALLFAALLALSRAQDEDGFFGWVAGGLAIILIFLRFDSFIAIAAIGAALGLRWMVDGRRPPVGFVVSVMAAAAVAHFYYRGPMRHYFFVFDVNLPSPILMAGAGVAALAVLFVLGSRREQLGPLFRKWIPVACAVAVTALALYALFLRQPGGKLAEYDATALRDFRHAYLFWPATIAALGGLVLLIRREFWNHTLFITTFTAFAIFFFYKIRIVPQHFWMTRRFLPIILPGALLLAAAFAFGLPSPDQRRRLWRVLAGTAAMAFIGWQYAVAAAPVAGHREYAGAIRQVETLASHFRPDDLVIVEARNTGGDFHVLALPLAYQYGLNVLVLNDARPDRRAFESFLAQALTKYPRVFFVGGAGTDLLSRRVTASPVAFAPLKVPEFETFDCAKLPNCSSELPDEAKLKDLGYSVYRLALGERPDGAIAIDVGYLDDLNVVGFHAREIDANGETYRWTTPQSFVVVPGIRGTERELVLSMSAGGRPAGAPPAAVEVLFNEVSLGRVIVTEGFAEYRLPVPAELAARSAQSDDTAQIKLVAEPWSPSQFLKGNGDTRQLGVMVTRVEIH